MANISKDYLKSMGLDDEQINAIIESKEIEENKKINVVSEKELRVTPISELKKYSDGTIVELPGFGDGQPFVAKLRRPSLLQLCKSGRIPNSLLSQASSLFANGAGALNAKGNTITDMYEVMERIAEASFVEPTYQELQDNGIQLSDDQLMAVFAYSQRGIKALENFRE